MGCCSSNGNTIAEAIETKAKQDNESLFDTCKVQIAEVPSMTGDKSPLNVQQNLQNPIKVREKEEQEMWKTPIPTQPSIDFSIFDINEKSYSVDDTEIKLAVSECKYIHRIITALRYYQSLNKTKNNDGQTIFSDFLSQKYEYYMDDLIRLKSYHANDLKEIHDLILKQSQNEPCDINKCIFIDRHCEIRDGKNGDIDSHKRKIEPLSSLHIQIWDSMHYYLYHLFDVGLRQLSDDHKEPENNYNDKWSITDKSMNRRAKEMKITREKLGRFFGRFTNKANKFTIQSVVKSSSTMSSIVSSSTNSEPQKTRLDAIYEHISSMTTNGITNDEIQGFIHFIQSHQYDTESIFDDVKSINIEYSNILANASSTSTIFAESLYDYINFMQIRGCSFSCGYSFVYWPYFKDKNNNRSFGKYKASELFISEGKYNNLKEEILSNHDNELDDIPIWNDNVVLKAKQYINTEQVKSMTAQNFQRQYFGFERGTPITLQHLQSIILYTDFSYLSSSFTATFRKAHDMEDLESIKKRNSKYFWLSRLFIESIQGFGYGYSDETLYCGMSIILNIPRANIYLRGPTSTSTQITVAQNFTNGGKGVMLQLQGSNATRFDVSWISRFPEEAERTFITGISPMQLKSIRVQVERSWRNYQVFCKVLYQLDDACNGEYMSDKSETNKDSQILTGILNRNELIPKYIMDCYDLFRLNLNTLEIDLTKFGGINMHRFKVIIKAI